MRICGDMAAPPSANAALIARRVGEVPMHALHIKATIWAMPRPIGQQQATQQPPRNWHQVHTQPVQRARAQVPIPVSRTRRTQTDPTVPHRPSPWWRLIFAQAWPYGWAIAPLNDTLPPLSGCSELPSIAFVASKHCSISSSDSSYSFTSAP